MTTTTTDQQIKPWDPDPLAESLRKAVTVLDAGIMSPQDGMKTEELRCLMLVAVDILEAAQANLREVQHA